MSAVLTFEKGTEDAVAAAHALLGQMLPDAPPYASLPRTFSGKPYLPAGPYLSVSHTRGAAACAVGTSPVGVDIETMRRITEHLIHRVCSDAEAAWVSKSENPEAAFLTLWTLKEAYMKYLGLGLRLDPRTVVLRPEADRRFTIPGSGLVFWTFQQDDLFISACSRQPFTLLSG